MRTSTAAGVAEAGSAGCTPSPPPAAHTVAVRIATTRRTTPARVAHTTVDELDRAGQAAEGRTVVDAKAVR